MRRIVSSSLNVGVLALVALVLAHHVILLLADGGAFFSGAGARSGDGYWSSVGLMVAAAAIGLTATGTRQLLRLHRQASRIRVGDVVVPESGARYLVRLFLPQWARLTILTSLLFVAQENLEHFTVGAPLPGFGVLTPPDFQFAWLVVVVVAASVALVASLVRWRTLVLAARLRATFSHQPKATSVRSIPRTSDWRTVGPLLARGLGRRAPPMVAAA
jgi:hypothetical protein